MTTTVLSLVTSIRDYYEILHNVLETDSAYKVSDYGELGAMITYGIIALKDFFYDLVTFAWLRGIWDLPIIVPEIGSSMISEISVLDGYFHNTFNFLDRPISYGETSVVISSLEKFMIGFINSLFLFLPTSTTHLVTMRRFMVQGLQAGYVSGLGSVAANIFWIASVIFGWRFIVIPWLSFDIFRYFLGFMLLIKYIVDCQNEQGPKVDDPREQQKVFLFSFVLTLTEQTCIYPFITNLSVGPEGSILESFPAQTYIEFISIHGSYLFGLLAGSLILLHATCWFWENPVYKLYLWAISFGKNREYMDEYYYFTNIVFTYLTFLCAMTSIPYYGLDYTIGGALGYQDHDIAFTGFAETPATLEMGAFSTEPSALNTRTNKGRHGRPERWKRRLRQVRAMDVELGEGAQYDYFPLEDLNYGFDRFWSRRKIRNQRSRFRVFPSPLMRTGKVFLSKPQLERGLTERTDFFRLMFEQVYTSTFHQYKLPPKPSLDSADVAQRATGAVARKEFIPSHLASNLVLNNELLTLLPTQNNVLDQRSEKIGENRNSTLKYETATLRKLVRKLDQRLKNSEIKKNLKRRSGFKTLEHSSQETLNKGRVYSKRWKKIFSRMAHGKTGPRGSYGNFRGKVRNSYQSFLNGPPPRGAVAEEENLVLMASVKKEQSHLDLSKADKQIFKYREALFNSESNQKPTIKGEFLRPLNYYLEKQNSFERKLRYYTPTIFRTLRAGTNAPYFATTMEGYFYYFKPSIRWERSLRSVRNRPRRTKRETPPRRLAFPSGFSALTKTELEQTNGSDKQTLLSSPDTAQIEANKWDRSRREQKPTGNYTISGKRAARYRQQIYKDVLQHWYYSPFNRLLVKFDVDLFIKRQPKSHFLTKNEENLLHLRRFLLFEHYNTLRWYTYMQHYRSMKSKIGGTKSFASGMYNQQFAGTFKKVRHLFAITPSDTLPTVSPLDSGRMNPDQDPLISLDDTPSILKYDQPLYNEYRNSSSNSIPKNFIIHEELISDVEAMEKNGVPKDLLNQSTQIIRDYLTRTHDTKRNYIKQLIKDKNYLELTQFIYKGRKTRGSKPVLNEARFLEQEKEYLLTDGEKTQLKNLEKIKMQRYLKPLQSDLWFTLMKKWKVNVANRTTLRSFLKKHRFKRKRTVRRRRYQFQNTLEYLTKELSVEPLFVRKNKNKKSRELKRTNSLRPTLTEEQEMLETTLVSTPIDNTLVAGASTMRPRGSNWVKMANKNQEKERFRNTFIWNPEGISGVPEIRRDQIRKFSQMNPNTKMIFVSDLSRSSLVKKEKELVSSVNSLSALLQKIKRKKTKLPHHKKYKKYKKNRRGMKVRPFPINPLASKLKNVFNTVKRRLLRSLRVKKIGRKPYRKNERRKWQRRSILEERAIDGKYDMRDSFRGMIPLKRRPVRMPSPPASDEEFDLDNSDDMMEYLRKVEANVKGTYFNKHRYLPKAVKYLTVPQAVRDQLAEIARNQDAINQIKRAIQEQEALEARERIRLRIVKYRELKKLRKKEENADARRRFQENLRQKRYLLSTPELRQIADQVDKELEQKKTPQQRDKTNKMLEERARLETRQQEIKTGPGPLSARQDILMDLPRELARRKRLQDDARYKWAIRKRIRARSQSSTVKVEKFFREQARQGRIYLKKKEAEAAERARMRLESLPPGLGGIFQQPLLEPSAERPRESQETRTLEQGQGAGPSTSSAQIPQTRTLEQGQGAGPSRTSARIPQTGTLGQGLGPGPSRSSAQIPQTRTLGQGLPPAGESAGPSTSSAQIPQTGILWQRQGPGTSGQIPQVRVLTPEQRAHVMGRFDPEVERRHAEEFARRKAEREKRERQEKKRQEEQRMKQTRRRRARHRRDIRIEQRNQRIARRIAKVERQRRRQRQMEERRAQAQAQPEEESESESEEMDLRTQEEKEEEMEREREEQRERQSREIREFMERAQRVKGKRTLTPEERESVNNRFDPQGTLRRRQEIARRRAEEQQQRERERQEEMDRRAAQEQQERERKARKTQQHIELVKKLKGAKKEGEALEVKYKPLIERTWPGRLRIRLIRRLRKTTRKHKAFGRIRRGSPYVKAGILKKKQYLGLQTYLIEGNETYTKRKLPRMEKMNIIFNRWKELLGTSQELDRNHLFRPIPVVSDYGVKKLRAHTRAERLRPLFQLRQQYSVKRLPRQRLRAYYKKFHAIRQNMVFRQAWWDKVLPQVRANLNVQFQHQQNSLLKRRYETLSEFEIVKRNNEAIEKKTEKFSLLSAQRSRASSSSERRKAEAEKTRLGINKIPLEIGDYDTRPLAIPAAIKLRKKSMLKLSVKSTSGLSKRASRLVKNAKKAREGQYASKEDQMKNIGPFNTEMNVTSNPSLPAEVSEVVEVSLPNSELPALSLAGKTKPSIPSKRPNDVISQVLEATLLNENQTTPVGNKHALIPTTSIPFYAGWDESLRKFVVTNRLLTRRDADYELRIRNNYDFRLSKLINLEPELGPITNVEFTSPLKGMAAGTAFAIAIPFGVFDTEQFFSVGHDAFAPIGWRRFAFRQTLLKTWLYQRASNKLNPNSRNRRKPRSKVIVRNKTTILNKTKPMKVISKLNYKIDEKVNPLFRATPIFNKKSNHYKHGDYRAKNNRFRTRLVRYRTKITKAPVESLLPSLGPRLTDVLPAQYTQIFFVGDRAYDDILIKRHLRDDFPEGVQLSNPSPRFTPDFTLRQLVKPLRFFHIKSELGHSYEDPYVIPRRFKFLRYKSAPMRWRPIGVQLLEGVSIPDFIKEVRKARAMSRYTMKQPVPVENKAEEEKKHKLPPRGAQQLVRNIQRIEPRAGGFVWDDDYLRLEQAITNVPFENYALQTKPTPLENNQTMNTGLAEKVHNYKALKTKLKKARRSNKLRERMKQLRYLL